MVGSCSHEVINANKVSSSTCLSLRVVSLAQGNTLIHCDTVLTEKRKNIYLLILRALYLQRLALIGNSYRLADK